MAKTPVTVEFNAVGMGSTIAQINLVVDAIDRAADRYNNIRANAQQAGESVKDGFSRMTEGAGGLFNRMNDLSFKMFLFQMAFQQLQGLAQGFYNVALKGNEDLNQSILSTQTSLVAVADVYKDGLKIEDPTEAIKALAPEIRGAIEDIRKDSLELVGVTSDQLVPLFQMLASNAGKITNQSKQWADPIEAAQKLTISFAASLGVMGIPLRQARQEMQSMLQGYIDQNSILAKQLGITNDMVKTWQKQGVLVDELQARLAPFVEGNKLALQTINGMIPNILEVIEEVSRFGFEPIYEPIVNQLMAVYKWLEANKEALTQGAISAIEFLIGLATQMEQAFKTAMALMAPFRDQLGELLQNAANFSGEAIQGFVSAINQAIVVLGALLNIFQPVLMAFNSIMTVLNETGLSKIIGWGLAIAGLTAAMSGLVVQGLAVMTFFVNIGGLLAGLASGTLMTASAFTGITTAWRGLTTAASALLSSLGHMNISLQALAASAGIAAAAMAALWVWMEAEKLKDVNETMDSIERRANKNSTTANQDVLLLKDRQKEVMKDGVISEEEKKEIGEIETRLKAAKKLSEGLAQEARAKLGKANDDQAKSLRTQIDSLENEVKRLDVEGNIALKMKGSPSLGDAYKRLREDAEQALVLLKENQFNSPQEAEQRAKEAIANTKQEIELGALSLEEARKRYEEIAKLDFLTAATRIAAEKELTTIIKLEGDRRKEIIEKNQQEIQQKIYQNRLSQITGEKELTEAKIKSAEAQLETTRKLIAQQEAIAASHGMTGTSEEKRKLLLEQEKIETEIAKLRREKVEQENKALVTNYDEMTATLSMYREQRLIGEVDYYRQLDVIQTSKLDEQIRQTKEKLKELARSDKEGREALLAQIADFEAKKAKLQNDAREREYKVLLTDYDESIALLTMFKEQKLVGEVDYFRQLDALNAAKFQEQIRQAHERLSLLSETDKEGREAMIAQIAEFEGKKAKLLSDGRERERKILVADYDEANAILTMNREKRLIEEEDFYQRSKAIAVGKYDEEIRQAREKLDDLAETDKEGREALIAQIAELETKKAKLINDADQRLLNQRIQAIRLATELLKLETERTNQVLTELSMGLSDENRQLELSNKALDTKKSLVETLMAVEKSYQELTKTSQSIELSRAERALDYFTKLNDEKIRGTILEKVYRDELQAIDKHGLTQKQLFEDRQEAEAKLFNTKLTNLLREQEIQKQLLELDLLREQSQLNQAVNQEKINVLKAQQAANEAQAKTAEAEGKVREATLVYQNAIAQGKTPQEIEEARIGLERARLSLESSRVNEVYSQRAIGYSQDALILAEGGLSRFDQLAQLRRELLRNQQNNAIQNINYEGEQLGVKQRIEKGTFLMENPDYGASVITPTINRAGYTRYGIPVPDDRYEVEPTGDRRLDGLFQESQRDYRSRVTPSEADLINAETDRRLEIFNPPKPRKDLKEWTARGWDVSLSPEELEEIKRQKTGNIVFFNPTTAPDYPRGDSPDAQVLTPIPLEDFISKESGLPSPDILQTLLPQFNDQVIPNQINQIIGLISELKGGLAAIAEAKPLVNPTINNNFVGAIESGDTMAAYRRETLRIIDSVIPKM